MSSRVEQKAAAKDERMRREAREAAGKRRARYLKLGGGLAAMLVVGVVVALLALTGGTPTANDLPARKTINLKQAAALADCTLSVNPENIKAGEHTTEKVTYKENPPVGGPHNPIPADAVGDASQLPANERPPVESWVHSLEHGRVQFQYEPNLPAMQVSQLRSLFSEDDYHVQLYANQTKMPFAVAATAWMRSLTCKNFSPPVFDALRAFRDEYRDKAPEQVP